MNEEFQKDEDGEIQKEGRGVIDTYVSPTNIICVDFSGIPRKEFSRGDQVLVLNEEE